MTIYATLPVSTSATAAATAGATAAATARTAAAIAVPRSVSRVEYSKSLLLRKVPRRSTIDDIKTVFETFGPIRDIYIPLNLATSRKETYAFIEFENLKSSIKAFEYFSINEMLLEGIILRVDYAKNGRRSPEQMGTFAAVAVTDPVTPHSSHSASNAFIIQ